ncbi:MAG: carboxymuconolactone decarboxylase family protein, partial [Bdellovibrionia bacterium]
MAHISLPEGMPGITGPLAAYPATAKPLTELAEVLLRGPSSLTSAERETIAAFVSAKNNCHFCMSSHAA